MRLVCAGLFVSVVVGVCLAETAAAAPIVHLPFDEVGKANSTNFTNTLSPRGGLYLNNVVDIAAGRFGRAAGFVGTSQEAFVGSETTVAPGGAGSLLNNLTSNFTIAAWVDLNNLNFPYPIVAGNRQSTTATRNWALYTTTSGGLEFLAGTGGSTVTVASDATALNPNAGWQHVAMTVSAPDTNGSMSVRFFVDGQLLGTQQTLADPIIINTGSNWWIGRDNGAFLASAQAGIDEFWAFDHVLSETEMTSLIQTNAIPEPGSVAILLPLTTAFFLRRRQSRTAAQG